MRRAFFLTQLDQPIVDSRQHCLELFIRRQAIFLPDESPQICKRTNGDVKTAFGLAGNFLRFGDDSKEFRRNDEGFRSGARVKPAEFTVCAMNAHQTIDAPELLERGGHGGVKHLAIFAVNGNRDESAEQWLAAADQFRAWLRCLASGQQPASEAEQPPQTSPAHA